MKQRYRKIDRTLAEQAVAACFERKWSRGEILGFCEKNAGVLRSEIYEASLTADFGPRIEAIEGAALYILESIEQIRRGQDPEDMVPVIVKPRPDGMTGEIRNIACLCIPHQLLGHVVKLALEPLLRARILPQQHASIPGRGQTGLVRQTRRLLNRKLGITCAQKYDGHNAYGSITYDVVAGILEKEIPRAGDILMLIRYMGKLAPDGHLIIGGYLDAWLFNLAMSYVLRYALSIGRYRRGKFHRYVIRAESYMDDFALLCHTVTDLARAGPLIARWSKEHIGLEIRATTGVIRWLPVRDEKRRKRLLRPSMRGCPSLDMGGYKIARTHIMMRPRVWKRVRRQLLRAWADLRRLGSLRITRARSLVAYYGFIKCSCSRGIYARYHVRDLMRAARRAVVYHCRLEDKHRIQRITAYLSRDKMTRYLTGKRCISC